MALSQSFAGEDIDNRHGKKAGAEGKHEKIGHGVLREIGTENAEMGI